MKTLIIRFICLFMALQVLFASTGFAVTEHYCKVRGKKTLLFGNTAPCCAKKMEKLATCSTAKTQVRKTKCCENHTIFHKLSTTSSFGFFANHQAQILVWTFVQPCAYFLDNRWLKKQTYFQINNYSATAPPLSGQQRLALLQTFII